MVRLPRPTSNAVLLVARGISKAFPGVQALREVDFELRAAEVHALVGENGAGKSTLMNAIAGVVAPDAGTIALDGVAYTRLSPARARALGIGFVRQEPALVGELTVAENITLGVEDATLGVPRARLDRRAVRRVLDDVRLEVDPATPVASLGPAQRQLVAVAKALHEDPKLLILDEPSSTLTFGERERLFELIAERRERGTGVVYISHRLDEVFAVATRATVLRNGERVASVELADPAVDEDRLISLMVGRELGELFPERPAAHPRDGHRLVLGGLLREVRPRRPDLELRGGEILGVAGLVGSGRTELVEAIFGARPREGFEVELDGRALAAGGPRVAINRGFGLVPEDRRGQGLIGQLSLTENLALAASRRVSRFGWLRARPGRELAEDYMRRLSIRAFGPHQAVETLSGGNQQKVVIAKWMARDSSVFIFDEPTKGVDVGAKAEIYQELRRLADAGRILILVSSEMPEILGLSDQILVMREGKPSAWLPRAKADAEMVLRAAFGREG